uniref:Retinol dehydrogenase 12-like n=1 Tax=Diabrotica virgifera virgifera TaxID=50390 RepID=A0A6P7GWU6_DIAVI
MGQIFTTKCDSDVRLDGKTAVITGANCGIGKETARDLYLRGATVILACRSVSKANEAIKEIKTQCVWEKNVGQLKAIELDLSRLKSVRDCAAKLLETEKEINILVNNAGVFAVPFALTEDGNETTFQVNHLGHFLFTLLLMPLLKKSTPARIVTVASSLHSAVWNLDLSDMKCEKRKYGSLNAYNESKVCNILFTQELARKLKEHNINGITVYSVHPGAVKTDAARYLDSGLYFIWTSVAMMFYKSPIQGAQTSIYCSVDEQCSNETGLYYAECKPTRPSKIARNEKLAEELWDMSLKLVGLDSKNDLF